MSRAESACHYQSLNDVTCSWISDAYQPPNGLEMSRPASSSIVADIRFAAAGRVGSIELLGGDDFVESFHEKTQGLRGEATDLLAEPLGGERSDLADLDPGLLREPGLVREFERQWEGGLLRCACEGHGDNSARPFVEHILAEDYDRTKPGLPLSYILSYFPDQGRGGDAGRAPPPNGLEMSRPASQR